ncbi:hypothetical protein DSM100688_0376 [Bifidobacterium ramosum]|uniref:Uncharacterized protein n=1 Tax=Bifidobacterium ramosum TaxID=1798158 RepID=A0A6L4X3K0_9BIFI|nr:hypothetical protein [Bifidobacterium ramosum]KAB8289296.1 hypothetical protein DSM100688_0376 [Bifidobacterium ramosum]NEG71001.1 hypothetical protein [Bifidobacterium ramosum]
MGTITLTGKTRGTTRLTVKAGGITTDTPVTVRSRNLLSYGPGTGDGLTATVNPDGSLHVTGSVAERHHGLEWAVTVPDGLKGKTVTYSSVWADNAGLYSYVTFDLASGGHPPILTGGKSAPIPEDATHIVLRLLAGDNYTPDTPVDLPSFKPILNLGGTPAEWMRPDNVEAIGGGMSR